MYIANYKHNTKTAKITRAIKADTLEKLIEVLEIMFPNCYVNENVTIYKESLID